MTALWLQKMFGLARCLYKPTLGWNSVRWMETTASNFSLRKAISMCSWGTTCYSFISHYGSTIDAAFNQHRPLALSPDDFLLPLVQAAARFIDAKLEKKEPILGLKPGAEKVKDLLFFFSRLKDWVAWSICVFLNSILSLPDFQSVGEADSASRWFCAG